MSKLFKLKEWFTLSEATQYLSTSFGELVTEADLLQLVLDRRLVVSVNLGANTFARLGEYVSPEDARLGGRLVGSHIVSSCYLGFGDPNDCNGSQALVFEDEIRILEGIFDLPLIGSEGREVARRHAEFKGLNNPIARFRGASFVSAGDGRVFELMRSLEEDSNAPGSMAQLKAIERKISSESIADSDGQELLENHSAARKGFLGKAISDPLALYHPYPIIDGNSDLMIRRGSLLRLITNIEEPNENSLSVSSDGDTNKEVSTAERKTLLSIIAALCSHSGIDLSKNDKAGNIVLKSAEDAGFKIGLTTIKNKLREANNL